MATYEISGLTLAIRQGGAFYRASAAPAPAPSGAITPALTVNYTDTSGNPQNTSVIDNVTTITGVAPFPVFLNAYGFVSTTTDANTSDKAFCTIEYLFEFGENRGTTHSTTGLSTDTERGGPVASYAYETPGTYQLRVWGRDSAGNQNYIRLNVVVTAPETGVNMTSGVIPTFASNTVYNAPANGTWGDINYQLNGLHNVIIRKSGAGADPVFGTVSLDNRNEPNTAITRTRGVRFLNCDIANLTYGNVGFDNCAAINGRVRVLTLQNMYSAADQLIVQNRTAQQAQNVRMARGLLLQNTGQLLDSGGGYVLIGEIRGLHLRGISTNKTTSGQHNVRGVFKESSFRNCLFDNTVVTGESRGVSYLKFQGWECTAGPNVPDAWPSTDMVVSGAGGRRLGLPLSQVCVSDCVMGLSSSVQPVANIGVAPENNILNDPAQGCELFRLDHCVTPWTDQWYTVDLSGRYLACRDYRLNNGAGALLQVGENTAHPNRTPTGWNGPTYIGAALDAVVPA